MTLFQIIKDTVYKDNKIRLKIVTGFDMINLFTMKMGIWRSVLDLY